MKDEIVCYLALGGDLLSWLGPPLVADFYENCLAEGSLDLSLLLAVYFR